MRRGYGGCGVASSPKSPRRDNAIDPRVHRDDPGPGSRRGIVDLMCADRDASW